MLGKLLSRFCSFYQNTERLKNPKAAAIWEGRSRETAGTQFNFCDAFGRENGSPQSKFRIKKFRSDTERCFDKSVSQRQSLSKY